MKDALMSKIRVAFYDAKDYDIASFEKANVNSDVEITFLETRLTEDTVKLAEGFIKHISEPEISISV